jgi:ERCC4-type nuclease
LTKKDFIYIDTYELSNAPEIVRIAKKITKYKVITMDAGDFQNAKQTIFIERKTPNDIWNRVYNKTWHKQIQKLQRHALKSGTVPWLIVEGSFEDGWLKSKGKMPIENCKCAVISATIRYGLSVWNTIDMQDTVETVVRMCKYADEGKLGSPKKIPYRNGVPDARVGVMMNVFRISQRQAEGLLRHEGSVIGVLRVLHRNPKKLEVVTGIGPATVKRMKRIMETQFV